MGRWPYPSELTDAEWALLEPLLPPAPTGRPRFRDLREIVDGLFSVLRTGCQWRYLPETYGPWSRVYDHFWHWREDGTWARALDVLRRAERVRQGRHPEPSGLLLDSQSVPTSERGGRVATTPASTSRATSGTC